MNNEIKSIHVVAAVIENANGKILIAKRPQHVHQGGLWEFPGGKVEVGESLEEALFRELSEELNIQMSQTQPVIQIRHQYPDKTIFLNVKRVTAFTGTAIGNEGQLIKWIDKSALANFDFPEANKAILSALQLPKAYLITPEHELKDRRQFLNILETKLQNGIKLVQLRAKRLSHQQYAQLFYQVDKITKHYSAILMVNTTIEHAIELKSSHVHLSSHTLINLNEIPAGLTCSASCHNPNEIKKANELGVLFIVISPVNHTLSHPNVLPIGWEKFSALCQLAKMPVFALGGITKTDSKRAIDSGAQGIAGISDLWNSTL